MEMHFGTSKTPVKTTSRYAMKTTNLNGSMKVQAQGETLNISGVKELGAANSNNFRDEVRGAMTELQRNIEIDLSDTMFVDSCGLGALISLHRTTCNRNGIVRLLNPTPPVQQILELTRMHRIFEIVNT
jgi:anti-sigma B factor antagonist